MSGEEAILNARNESFLLQDCARFSPILAVMRTTNSRRTSSCCWTFARLAVIFTAGMMVMQAQESSQRSPASSLRVHGSSTFSVTPDQAQFDIGIVAQASTAKAATDQNTSQSNVLVLALREAFPEASVKNLNFSVNPNYEYPQGGTPTVAGYTANNTVRLLLNDLSKLQTVIEIAIKSGANSINRLSFTMRDENSARAQALAAAAHQAEGSAQVLAASLKLKLARLLTVEEGQPVIVSPPRELSFDKLQSTSLAPISPGAIDVHADLDITYEVTSNTR
jgi:uncharacterized protein